MLDDLFFSRRMCFLPQADLLSFGMSFFFCVACRWIPPFPPLYEDYAFSRMMISCMLQVDFVLFSRMICYPFVGYLFFIMQAYVIFLCRLIYGMQWEDFCSSCRRIIFFRSNTDFSGGGRLFWVFVCMTCFLSSVRGFCFFLCRKDFFFFCMFIIFLMQDTVLSYVEGFNCILHANFVFLMQDDFFFLRQEDCFFLTHCDLFCLMQEDCLYSVGFFIYIYRSSGVPRCFLSHWIGCFSYVGVLLFFLFCLFCLPQEDFLFWVDFLFSSVW